MKEMLSFLACWIVSMNCWLQEPSYNHSIYHPLLENKGQWDEQILFQSKSQGQTIWVQQHGFVYDIRDYSNLQNAHANPANGKSDLSFKSTLVSAHFIGSNAVTNITKDIPTPHYFNFFLGNDQSKWKENVKGYQQVVLNDFYPSIDLRIIDNDSHFKYELWCAPGSDPSQIAIEWKSAEKISVEKNGNLKITTSLGAIIEEKPIVYQLKSGKMTLLKSKFVLTDNIVTFAIENWDKDATLIIDPTLVFATYCGSVTDNFGMTATYGYDGTAYSAGTVYGNAYPTPDGAAYDVTSNFTVANVSNSITTDAFISKYAPDGSTMLWTTFLGGGDNNQGTETAHSLICDKQNNVYLYGVTSSLDFPIVNGYQSTHAGGTPLSISFNGSNFGSAGTDIYVAKISANGHSLLGSTYMGGSQNDGVNYKLTSGNYNSVAAYDSLTTNYGDQFRGEIMIDSLGNCIVASCSRSTNFPTFNPFQANNAGQQDGVLFKLSSNLSTLQWSSYFGGSNNDACYSVKIDSTYNILFAGGTSSTNLPGSAGSFQPTYLGGKADGFVGKLSSNGQSLIRSSYIGTSLYDQLFFVEIDRLNNVYVLGQSMGGQFPIVNATGNTNSGQFIAKINPSLTAILNATTFGNSNSSINISPSAFLVDICGNIYVSGWGANILQSTPLSGMPVSANAFQQNPANGFDFYLGVFKSDFSGLLYGTYLGGAFANEHVDGGTSRFDKNGVVYQSVCGGCGGHSDFPTTTNAWSQQNLSSNCNNLVFKFDFDLIPDAQFTASSIQGCEDFTVQFNNTSVGSNNYLWDFGNGDSTSVIFSPQITYTEPGIYEATLLVTDSVCLLTDTAKTIITVFPEVQLALPNDTVLCAQNSITLNALTLGTATQFIWSSNAQFTDTLNVSLTDSVLTITVTNSTTFYLQASNSFCSAIDSVRVFYVFGSLDITGNDSICVQESTSLTAAIAIPNVTFQYAWSPLNLITSTANPAIISANPTANAWIYCTATGSNGCIAKDSIFIHVGAINGVVNAVANPGFVTLGNSSTLSAIPLGYAYNWTPSSTLNVNNNNTVIATPTQNTTYTVSVTDGICVQTDTVSVKVVQFICDRAWVYVPNAFTPNGDGKNDVLYVRSEITEDLLFRVYNRWGELVFETKDISKGWDGKFKGKLLDPDTYDYYLEVTCAGGEQQIIKGNTTLIR